MLIILIITITIIAIIIMIMIRKLIRPTCDKICLAAVFPGSSMNSPSTNLTLLGSARKML